MNPAELAVVVSSGLFLGMLLCLEAGYRIGRYASEKTESAHEGTGTIEAAVFALLGLLLGFTFANGISHLDQRRELIVREANAIGTAYLRLDLLPVSQQPEMRRLFREYLDTRLRVYEKLPALHTHLPALIFGLSISVALLSGLLAGYDMARRKDRSWFHVVLYAVVIALTVYTVLDLDNPRVGLIRLNAADNALIQLRDSIR